MKPTQAWLQEYQVYKTKICKLERELQYSFDDIELQEFCQIATTLKKKIVRLKELSTNTDVKYIDRIKVLMEQIESEILQIKKKNRETYETLNMEEKNLTREIESLREVIDSWTTNIAAPLPITIPHHYVPSKSNVNNIPTEVIEYEDFLKKNGGLTGGWDQQDHSIFLKMYTKHKNNDQMIITQLLKLLPHCNIFSIQEHLHFYKSLQEYTLKRKNAIQNWKKEKQTERDEMIQWKEEDQVLQMRVEEKIKQDLIQKEKELRRKELEEWKQQKLKEREAKTKQEEEKQKLKKKEQSKEIKSKREQMKIKLEEYKQQKLLQQSSSEEEEEETLTAEQIERIRLKNVQYLHRRKLLKESKEPKEKQITITPTVFAERDFSRLIAPTESHSAKLIEKAIEKNHPNKSQQSLFILTTQHRSIPSWRK